MAKLKADPKIMDRVRELVWDTGLSYVALDEKLDIRYPGTISGWVNSEKTISTEALRRLCPDTAGKPGPLAQLLAGCKKPVFVVGDGAQVCYNNLRENLPLEPVPAPWLLGRAAGVALAGLALWQAGGAVPAGDLRPAYHRLSQAQRERQEKLKESERS